MWEKNHRAFLGCERERLKKKKNINKLDNLDGKIPRTTNLPILNQKEIENLNRPITGNKIKSVIKKSPGK